MNTTVETFLVNCIFISIWEVCSTRTKTYCVNVIVKFHSTSISKRYLGHNRYCWELMVTCHVVLFQRYSFDLNANCGDLIVKCLFASTSKKCVACKKTLFEFII